MDALRLLPLLAVLLWVFPLFWPSGPAELAEAEPVTMSAAVQYVFTVWAILIACSFALRRMLRAPLKQDAAEVEDAHASETR